MSDTDTNLAGPKIVFSPDTSLNEAAVDNFNPMAAVRHAAEQTTPASFAGLSNTISTPSQLPHKPASPAGIDEISATLDMLHQAEQALTSEIHHINSQETSALDEIQTLVGKAKSIEQREDQLSTFIKRIQERRTQISQDPTTAGQIAQENWLRALVEQFQTDTTKSSGLPVAVTDNRPGKPVQPQVAMPMPSTEVPLSPPPVAPLRPVPLVPSQPLPPKVTPPPAPAPAEIITPPVVAKPILPVTQQPPSSAEQKIVSAVRAVQPEARQAFLDTTTHVYRSTDGNGVVMQHGKDTLHISDGELIQAGLFVEDLAEIKELPAA